MAGLFGQALVCKLDPEQTKPDGKNKRQRGRDCSTARQTHFDKLARLYEHYVPPASAIETHFRHSGWSMDRKRVKAALVACHCPPSRLERFDRCGSDAWYQVSDDGEKIRVSANYCGDRFCIPCANARARKIKWSLEQMMSSGSHLFVTLTLAKDGKPLHERLTHLIKSFERMRNQKWWSEEVSAGAFFIEITRGAAGDFWHVHLHAVVCARFIDRGHLSNCWRLASGGSYIVHVESVTSTDKAASYIAKYATKGFDHEVIADSECLIECVIALKGRRLVSTFGAWRGRALDGPAKVAIVWKSVGRLSDIYSAAHRGELWAKVICRKIRCGDPELYADIPDGGDDG